MRTAPSVLAVDLSCSGLAAATSTASVQLSPAVAPASVLVTLDGSDLPPGGDRIECSDRVDAVLERRPQECLRDPVAHAHRARVDVAGLSVPVPELLAAPVSRALRWADAGPATPVVVAVPSSWGVHRTKRLTRGMAEVGVSVRLVRAALVAAEALPSSSSRWAVCVESCARSTTVSLIERSRTGLTLVDRMLLHRHDPGRDQVRDDEVHRILDTVTALRDRRRETATGSSEILVRGRGAARVVDACDRARMLSYVVPPLATAEAAARLFPAM